MVFAREVKREMACFTGWARERQILHGRTPNVALGCAKKGGQCEPGANTALGKQPIFTLQVKKLPFSESKGCCDSPRWEPEPSGQGHYVLTLDEPLANHQSLFSG